MSSSKMSSVRVLYIVTNYAWLCGTLSTQANVYEADNLGDEAQWLAWKLMHGKNYSDAYEDQRHKKIWQDNLKIISKHNRGNYSYTLAMNHLGDLTEDEYRTLMLGIKYRPGMKTHGSTFLPPSNTQPPFSVDWRKKGYVTNVKNQGSCGSCWAFSATGSLEGQNYKKTGKLVSLSEQNLVDCSYAYGNRGCNGGLMDYAFSYVEDYGIDTEGSYPYTGIQQFCWYNPYNIGANCSGYVDLTQGSEIDLQLAVATVGPISVAIDADHRSFQLYKSGVYDEPDCSSTELDHAMLVVGYGVDKGTPYWLLKNSWGKDWGMEGYIMMSKFKDNQCGIASLASYPLM